MDFLYALADFILHVDEHLTVVIEQYGVWTYLVLFLIIFCETGLVATPFLPGDSLLFAAGTFAATGALSLPILLALLSIAAILGDSVNYFIGRAVGPKVFHEKSRFLKKEYLDRTEAFYERHGGKTIIIARFLPIIRTFAPFVAGVGKMSYTRFLVYNVVGGLLWIFLLVPAGYLFGNLPVVRENFELVILAIIALSILPGILEFMRHRLKKAKTP